MLLGAGEDREGPAGNRWARWREDQRESGGERDSAVVSAIGFIDKEAQVILRLAGMELSLRRWIEMVMHPHSARQQR